MTYDEAKANVFEVLYWPHVGVRFLLNEITEVAFKSQRHRVVLEIGTVEVKQVQGDTVTLAVYLPTTQTKKQVQITLREWHKEVSRGTFVRHFPTAKR